MKRPFNPCIDCLVKPICSQTCSVRRQYKIQKTKRREKQRQRREQFVDVTVAVIIFSIFGMGIAGMVVRGTN